MTLANGIVRSCSAALLVACGISPAPSGTNGGASDPAEQGAASGDSPAAVPTAAPSTAALGSGHVTYTLEGDVFRLATVPGARPENISALITPKGARQRDRRLNTSANGAFYVFETGNVDSACNGTSCLAIAPGSAPAEALLVLEGGNRIEGAANLSAVSNDGTVVLFAASGSAHPRDLFVTRRTGAAWSAAAALTGASTFDWNDLAAIHPDGTRVLFDCGSAPEASEGGSVCEVGIDGAGFKTVVTSADAPATVTHKGAVHHASYSPDGSVVFEANWDGERIWRKAGKVVTDLSTSAFANDNSPCVLPDGRIVSLWLDRPGNAGGAHEIKVMGAQGDGAFLLLTGSDVSDVGIGCGN